MVIDESKIKSVIVKYCECKNGMLIILFKSIN